MWSDLRDADVSNKRVLLRLDLNVPLDHGSIRDTTRLKRALPTLRYLYDHARQVILLTHLGRPKGHPDPQLSTHVLMSFLSQHFDSVSFVPEVVGDSVRHLSTAVAGSKSLTGSETFSEPRLVLLENVRFHPGEEKNDPLLAEQWSTLADIYVNDAFSVSHRAHASVEAITRFLPSIGGFLMAEELGALSQALDAPQHPVMAIVGGAKVSTKLAILDHLMTRVDVLVVGGAMANTFLKVQGYSVGRSLCEDDMLPVAERLLRQADAGPCALVLPQDVVVAKTVHDAAPQRICSVQDNTDTGMIVDAGPMTVGDISKRVDRCSTVIWNGPLGVAENPAFSQATQILAQHVARRSQAGLCCSLAGGGDTVSIFNQLGIEGFSYISTAGGAFLEWLGGQTLPGIEALRQGCSFTK